MAKVIGKEQLCSTDLRYFKAVQGIDGKTLFDRYRSLEIVVKNYVDPKYQDFLAYPVKEGDTITFHGKKYKDTPLLLTDLQGYDKTKYLNIKDDTLAYYYNKIDLLRNSDKSTEAGFLADAVKYVDDRFVYCYDGTVVLGVWGMQVRDNVRENISEICKNLVIKKKTPVEEPIQELTGPTGDKIVLPPPLSLPKNLSWFKRLWMALTSKSCLKLLLWILLLFLFLWLLSWLFRSCDFTKRPAPIPYPIENKPWIKTDPLAGSGGIYNPGNPYAPVPTPPGYAGILPPQQGVLPSLGNVPEIIPGNPSVVGNRLNILLENEDKSIMNLAKDFKTKYPDSDYKIVYYDNAVKRMQIEIPSAERDLLKQKIPDEFAPDYELFVFDEALFEGSYVPNDPAFSDRNKSWYLKAINAQQAWDITRGSNKLTVAIVDNGFNIEHPELRSKVVMPYNVWQHSPDVFPQQFDHGTHVAGTALAIADNGKGICGIAPGCAFMPIQVADDKCRMTTTSVLDGILYALYQGADVVNVSLGSQFTGLDQFSEQEQRDLIQNHFKEEERLWREVMRIAENLNSTLVVAAGNDNVLAGIDPIQRPELIVTVTAVDKNSRHFHKAEFSNYGEYSTVSAPGVDIYSCIGKNDYTSLDGTSMAAPIVSGAIALMKSLNDSLTSRQIIGILQNTGLETQGDIGNLIQLDKALEKVKQ